MSDNQTTKKTEYETVFDYTHGEHRFTGSQRIDNDEIHVSYDHYYEGKCIHGISASRPDVEMAKVFFYNELKLKLGGSWLIMDTLIRKEIDVFRARIKRIERKIPAAIIKKYTEILGPLEDIDQDILDKAEVQLKLICEGWHKAKARPVRSMK